ncbi:MAG: ribokinase [Caldilineales bacterium]|nr:ribokinase [Caldilineales bacterium]
MTIAPTVLVVGSLNMDQIFRLPRFPRPGETMLAPDVITAPGGKGANQAVAAARMGAGVRMVGCVGDDAFGGSLRQSLVAAGVEASGLRSLADAPTGTALIMLVEGEDNSIVVAPGANDRVTVAALDAIDWSEVAVLLVQFEIPLEVTAEAMRRARAAGATVILDPAPPRPCPPDLLALAHILTPNETEAEALAGRPVTDLESAEQVGRILLAGGEQRVIVKLGDQGALVCTDSGCRHWPALPVPVLDTTAAGDAFCGALAAGLAAGAAFDQAMTTAMAAGALAVTKLGAQPSLPTRMEVEELLRWGSGD